MTYLQSDAAGEKRTHLSASSFDGLPRRYKICKVAATARKGMKIIPAVHINKTIQDLAQRIFFSFFSALLPPLPLTKNVLKTKAMQNSLCCMWHFLYFRAKEVQAFERL